MGRGTGRTIIQEFDSSELRIGAFFREINVTFM